MRAHPKIWGGPKYPKKVSDGLTERFNKREGVVAHRMRTQIAVAVARGNAEGATNILLVLYCEAISTHLSTPNFQLRLGKN